MFINNKSGEFRVFFIFKVRQRKIMGNWQREQVSPDGIQKIWIAVKPIVIGIIGFCLFVWLVYQFWSFFVSEKFLFNKKAAHLWKGERLFLSMSALTVDKLTITVWDCWQPFWPVPCNRGRHYIQVRIHKWTCRRQELQTIWHYNG